MTIGTATFKLKTVVVDVRRDKMIIKFLIIVGEVFNLKQKWTTK